MDPHAFHHALYVDTELCTGCSHCMRVCPTEAIRVRNGIACIDPEKCIDCGNCYRACPANAIAVEQDDLEKLNNYSVKIALVPSVFIGQFTEEHSIESVYSALHTLGFDTIFEVENGVEVLLEKLKQYVWQNRKTKPLISSYCPAVVRLIQVKYPALVENIIRLKPPQDISATYCRQLYIDKGFTADQIGIFYITPCAAKIAAAKSPVGDSSTILDGVINMDYIYNRVLQVIHQGGSDYQEVDVVSPSEKGIRWSLTRGEGTHIDGRVLAVDGIRDVSNFLEKVELGHAGAIDFLELRACKESCAAGILTPGNPFLTVENLDKRAAKKGKSCTVYRDQIDTYREFLSERIETDEIQARPIAQLDQNVSEAIERLQQLKCVLESLPGIDCGACGAPSCHSLAEDVVLNQGELSQCPFMNIKSIKEGRMSINDAEEVTERVWGKRIGR